MYQCCISIGCRTLSVKAQFRGVLGGLGIRALHLCIGIRAATTWLLRSSTADVASLLASYTLASWQCMLTIYAGSS